MNYASGITCALLDGSWDETSLLYTKPLGIPNQTSLLRQVTSLLLHVSGSPAGRIRWPGLWLISAQRVILTARHRGIGKKSRGFCYQHITHADEWNSQYVSRKALLLPVISPAAGAHSTSSLNQLQRQHSLFHAASASAQGNKSRSILISWQRRNVI